MPDGDLSKIEELYNKLVKSGTSALRDVNARNAAKDALVGAITSFLKKHLADRPDAQPYIDEMARSMAGAMVETEPLQPVFRGAQSVLGDLAQYLEKRLLIPAQMQSAAESLAGRNVNSVALSQVKNTVASGAINARSLDDGLRSSVDHSFSLKPSVVLDPTLLFVKKVDATYGVSITSFDTLVRLRTGFSLERPLTSSAKLEGSLRVEVTPRAGLTGYVRGMTRFDDIYSRPRMAGSELGAGVGWAFAPSSMLTLDYTAKNVFGPDRNPEHGVFLGIKIRF